MKLLMPIFLTAILCLPAISMAAPKGERGGGFKKALKQLDLSDEQKKKLKEMRVSQKEKKSHQGGELKKLREEMKNKFVSDASETELQAIHSKIKTLREKRADERFKKLLSIRSILTIEQRKKFQELQMRPRKGKRSKKK